MSPEKKRNTFEALVSIAILALGIVLVVFLVRSRPTPTRAEETERAFPVEVIGVTSGPAELRVTTQGTVRAAQEVRITPEIPGRVIWVSDRLAPGGILAEGEPILRLDPREYRLARNAARAEVERARVELRLERNRRDVARREWEMFDRNEADAADPGLALREPQLQAAIAALDAARAQLARAELDLERTELRAPFEAAVQSKSIDRGQQVTPQVEVANLVGIDHYWVEANVPVGALRAIRIPTTDESDDASRVVVRARTQGGEIERSGRVLRLLRQIAPLGTQARLLVRVDDPLGGERDGRAEPLLLGSLVEVSIEAEPFSDVFELPPSALRRGDRAFVVDDAHRLAIRKVEVFHRELASTSSSCPRDARSDSPRSISPVSSAGRSSEPRRDVNRGAGTRFGSRFGYRSANGDRSRISSRWWSSPRREGRCPSSRWRA